jgi:hypothetical protein
LVATETIKWLQEGVDAKSRLVHLSDFAQLDDCNTLTSLHVVFLHRQPQQIQDCLGCHLKETLAKAAVFLLVALRAAKITKVTSSPQKSLSADKLVPSEQDTNWNVRRLLLQPQQVFKILQIHNLHRQSQSINREIKVKIL